MWCSGCEHYNNLSTICTKEAVTSNYLNLPNNTMSEQEYKNSCIFIIYSDLVSTHVYSYITPVLNHMYASYKLTQHTFDILFIQIKFNGYVSHFFTVAQRGMRYPPCSKKLHTFTETDSVYTHLRRWLSSQCINVFNMNCNIVTAPQ